MTLRRQAGGAGTPGTLLNQSPCSPAPAPRVAWTDGSTSTDASAAAATSTAASTSAVVSTPVKSVSAAATMREAQTPQRSEPESATPAPHEATGMVHTPHAAATASTSKVRATSAHKGKRSASVAPAPMEGGEPISSPTPSRGAPARQTTPGASMTALSAGLGTAFAGVRSLVKNLALSPEPVTKSTAPRSKKKAKKQAYRGEGNLHSDSDSEGTATSTSSSDTDDSARSSASEGSRRALRSEQQSSSAAKLLSMADGLTSPSAAARTPQRRPQTADVRGRPPMASPLGTTPGKSAAAHITEKLIAAGTPPPSASKPSMRRALEASPLAAPMCPMGGAGSRVRDPALEQLAATLVHSAQRRPRTAAPDIMRAQLTGVCRDCFCGGSVMDALFASAARGHERCLKAVLASGDQSADVVTRAAKLLVMRNRSGRCVIHAVSEKDHEDCLQMLLQLGADPAEVDTGGRTALHVAAASGASRCAAVLIDVSFDSVSARDREGRTPLHLAARAGYRNTVQLLLESAADPSAADIYGQLPIHGCHTAAVLQLLLEAGASLDSVDGQGWGVVHHAASNNDVDTLSYLCDAVAGEVDRCDAINRTPLHIAAAAGHAEAIALLLVHGANAHAIDSAGLTPASLAASKGRTACAKILDTAIKRPGTASGGDHSFSQHGAYYSAAAFAAASASPVFPDHSFSAYEAETKEEGEDEIPDDESEDESFVEALKGLELSHVPAVDVTASPSSTGTASADRAQANTSTVASELLQLTAHSRTSSAVGSSRQPKRAGSASATPSRLMTPASPGFKAPAFPTAEEEAALHTMREGEVTADSSNQETVTSSSSSQAGPADAPAEARGATSLALKGPPGLRLPGGPASGVHESGSGSLATGALAPRLDQDVADTRSTTAEQVSGEESAADVPRSRGRKLNRDYVAMAQAYTAQKEFRDAARGEAAAICVLCHQQQVTRAFLPCEHAAACDACIERSNIGPVTAATAAAKRGAGEMWSTCPVCMETILLVAACGTTKDSIVQKRVDTLIAASTTTSGAAAAVAPRFKALFARSARLLHDYVERKRSLSPGSRIGPATQSDLAAAGWDEGEE